MATSQDDFIQQILNTVQIKQNTQSSSFDQYIEKTYEFLDAVSFLFLKFRKVWEIVYFKSIKHVFDNINIIYPI